MARIPSASWERGLHEQTGIEAAIAFWTRPLIELIPPCLQAGIAEVEFMPLIIFFTTSTLATGVENPSLYDESHTEHAGRFAGDGGDSTHG